MNTRKALHLLLSKSPSFSSSSSSAQSHRFFCFSSSIFCYNHFSSSSVPSPSINKTPDPIFIDYLINTLGFSKTQLDSVSKYIQSRKTLKKPDSVVHLLREVGLSETQIQKVVLLSPKILFADVQKTLKPKLSLFQNELGLTGSHLGRFISANPALLGASLEQRLIPNINILKKFIPEIENKENKEREQFIQQQRCYWLGMDPKKLLSNISFLQSCGIVGDQLSGLLQRNTSLLIRKESELRDLVCKAQGMGLSCDSRMLVHALHILGCLSSKTIESKFKLLRSFGFSHEECSTMFRKQPLLLTSSEKRLKLGIEFFESVGFERTMLVYDPTCLMYSLEKRVIPRYRVYQILKSKQQLLLNNKCPSFPSLLRLAEKSFLENYVFKFGDNAEELLAAYNNGNVLNSSKEGN